MQVPLAERLRPSSLSQLVGQQHLTGEGSILQRAIANNTIPSMILWGPPGVGKTTIANIIAHSVNASYFQLSAISSGVKEVREVIDKAKQTSKAILFIDEIHRFNKGQQDALLGAVEVNSALLSRCQVFVLKALDKDDLLQLLNKAVAEDELLQQKQIELKETEAMLRLSGGDARKLLNILELVVESFPLSFGEGAGGEVVITDELVLNTIQQKMALYDKSGEQHYDIISAFIKSIRGSDPNAAVYWLARMIEGGEDVKFIARRLLILASEDIGNANPNALLLANATFEAVTKIGYPESQLILSQCAIYLASSPKSNSATVAIGEAMAAVKQYGDLPVPLHIRNAPTKLMKELGYKKGYEYSHDYENHFSSQEYLPDAIKGKQLYNPAKNAREEEIRKFLKQLWKEKYNY
jgi:putative ATPase